MFSDVGRFNLFFSRPSLSLILSQPFPLQASLVALQSRQTFLNEQKTRFRRLGCWHLRFCWLGSYRGEDSTHDMARNISRSGFILWHPSFQPSILSNREGLFAVTIGLVPFVNSSGYNLKATWFIPSHGFETFPDKYDRIRDAGHTIGLHGYDRDDQFT
jgi:hypothetical protein